MLNIKDDYNINFFLISSMIINKIKVQTLGNLLLKIHKNNFFRDKIYTIYINVHL